MKDQYKNNIETITMEHFLLQNERYDIKRHEVEGRIGGDQDAKQDEK